MKTSRHRNNGPTGSASSAAGSSDRQPLDKTIDRAADEVIDERIARIIEHPAYLAADQDLRLLEDKESRGLRLQLEYLKTDWQLRKRGIDHTIVVFGGARVVDPSVAEQRLAEAQRRRDEKPDDPLLQRELQTAERMSANSRYYEIAREFGRLVGQEFHKADRGRLVVMTGGGPGIMEAVHRGANDAGADSVGLNIELPMEQMPNPYITPGLCFKFRYFALRKLHFLQRARALVTLPGGFGTLDELFETLTLVSTRKIAPLPIVLIGESYWRKVVDMDFMVAEGVVSEQENSLYRYCDTAEEAWLYIQEWYRARGETVFVNAAGMSNADVNAAESA